MSRPQCVKSALVQERVALWSREAYMCQHICVSSKLGVVWKMAAILSRPQCVKSALVQERVALWSREAYMCQHICVSSKLGEGG